MKRAVLVALGLALASAVQAADLTPVQDKGRQVFGHRCGMCHREGGTGTFILARRLGPTQSLLEQRRDLKPEYVRYVVRWGLMNMPRLSRVEVPDADLDALIAYLGREGASPGP